MSLCLSEQAKGRRLNDAERLCVRRGVRFTPLRRRVFELLLDHAKPVGAYELLDELRHSGYADAPPTVYRALEFLREQGLVHRVRSSNTFLACSHPGTSHDGLLLLCHGCGRAEEVDAEPAVSALQRQAARLDFQPDSQLIEIDGLCQDCAHAEHLREGE